MPEIRLANRCRSLAGSSKSLRQTNGWFWENWQNRIVATTKNAWFNTIALNTNSQLKRPKMRKVSAFNARMQCAHLRLNNYLARLPKRPSFAGRPYKGSKPLQAAGLPL